MPDMAAIAAALSSLKAAKDITQAMVGLRDAAAFQEKRLELQSKILDAQEAAFSAQQERATLIQRIRELEEKVARLETWDVEKQRYDLTEIGTGAFAYVVKPAMRGAEPTHCICGECYEHGQKSILQITSNIYGSVTMQCPRCKSEVSASEDHPDYPLKREYAGDPKERARAALETCPICLTGKLAVKAVRPHHLFGDVGGLQVRTLQCDKPGCGHTEERDHDPRRGIR